MDLVDDLATVIAALPRPGEAREGQVTMAHAVEAVVDSGGHLIAAAGTGTGKSLAYLVPIVRSGKKALVATATKALQDQLASQDIPQIAEALDPSLDWAVLKGRGNYLCLQRAHEHRQAADQLTLAGVDDDDLRGEIEALIEWGGDSETGDRSELEVEPSSAAWGAVSVGPRECPGRSRCPSGGDCFAEKARDHAAEASICVVNHHLYGLDIANAGQILPEHDIVVIDEAHSFHDTVVRAAGFELSLGRCRSVMRAAGAVLAESDDKLEAIEDAADQLIDVLSGRRGERVEVDDSLASALAVLRQAVERVDSLLAALPDDMPLDASSQMIRARQACAALMTDIDAVSYRTDDEVAWVPYSNGPASLQVAPIDVSARLQEEVWSQRIAVLTSATIPPRAAETLGFEASQVTEIDVGSPFDYENNALLYCATSIPDPRDEDYQEATHRELETLIVAAEGRTLGLFTSYRAMRAAHDYLEPRLPWPLLSQDQAPKPALIDSFLTDEHTSLFATMGFWQGVDLPGETLSLVTIDRIPFPRPDDPLLQAQRDRAGRGAFGAIDLPRAAMLLAQGAGRLIRSSTDRGVVAVLDRRLAKSKSYRWELINALPPMPRTANQADAVAFLQQLRM